MAAKLILLGDEQQEHTLGSFSTLGRHPENTIQVLDRIVSKEHATLTLDPNNNYRLRDLSSLNGTFVNGAKITELTLKTGDEISMGSTRFRFECEEAAPPRSPVRGRLPTMLSNSIQSEIRSRVAATSNFLPAAEISDIGTLRVDYEKLRVAHDLSQRLALHSDLNRLLQQIVDETFRMIQAERAVILLYDTSTDELQPKYVRHKRGEEIHLSRSILDEVKRHKRAVLSSDASMDERFKSSQSIIMQGIRSAMCVPLLIGDEMVGAFHVDSTLARGAFTEKDLQLFTGIAAQAAVAIHNQRLVTKIEKEASTRAQFQRLVSPNLVDQIVSGALQLQQGGTQRIVTMLFADIRGFTEMSERHSPQTMVETLNEYFEFMVEILFRHGGTLDKYVGDEIIGLFGAPVDIPDAAERSIRCGLDMLSELERFNLRRRQSGCEPIEIGIGLNTGIVIAGAIGSPQTLQYTVIGDAVNVTARLCSLARAGELLVTSSTLESCKEAFGFEPRTPVKVKGKVEPLEIFSILDTPIQAAS